jgi:hypothetical protein
MYWCYDVIGNRVLQDTTLAALLNTLSRIDFYGMVYMGELRTKHNSYEIDLRYSVYISKEVYYVF